MDRLLDPALPDAEFVALLEQPLQLLYTSTSTQEVRSSVALSPVRVSFAASSRPPASFGGFYLIVFAGCFFISISTVAAVRVRQCHCALFLTGVLLVRFLLVCLCSGLAVLDHFALAVMPVS